MRRLGKTVPFAAYLGLAGPLFAEQQTLLDALLQNAPAISAALTNVAQNLGEVDGSFALAVERDFAALAAGLEGWSTGRAETAAGINVHVTDLQDDTLLQLGGLVFDVNAIATTAVGSLQAADMTGSFNAATLTDRIAVVAGTTSLAVETRGGVAGPVFLQNLSINSGEVLGSVEMQLADVESRIGSITTTALGALQNGALRTTVDLSATVQGQMGEITASTAAVLVALVGP